MAGKFETPRRRKAGWLALAAVAGLLAGALLLKNTLHQESGEETLPSFTAPAQATAEDTQSSVPTSQTPVTVTASATVAVQGDLLMHATFFQSKYNPVCRLGEGEYDFSSIFRYLSEYVSGADYAAVNLETTFGGDAFPYQGNPSFNCPDDLMRAVEDAGYDLLLTANNHSYDTLMSGINRTLEQIQLTGLDALGTRLSQEEPRFLVKEINGIRIGMVCYTYTMTMSGGKPRLNDNSPVEKPEQLNYFTTSDLDAFYAEMEQIMDQMQNQGVQATMLFLHWGTEYETRENEVQQRIAQKMCDLGFDVIVGGHPHVVQPMALLESNEDPEHKTVCIYSLGNAVSNQRRELMRLKTGHTEDGALFTVTFEEASDGTAAVADCDILPTWVNLYENEKGKKEYNILPLDPQKKEQWKTQFGVSDAVCVELQNSYDRTMSIVGEGLEQCREYLAQQRRAR